MKRCTHSTLYCEIVEFGEANVMPSPLILIKNVSMNSIKPKFVTALEVSGTDMHIYIYEQWLVYCIDESQHVICCMIGKM